VQVPPFINEGEKIRVDTAEGAYMSRAVRFSPQKITEGRAFCSALRFELYTLARAGTLCDTEGSMVRYYLVKAVCRASDFAGLCIARPPSLACADGSATPMQATWRSSLRVAGGIDRAEGSDKERLTRQSRKTP